MTVSLQNTQQAIGCVLDRTDEKKRKKEDVDYTV